MQSTHVILVTDLVDSTSISERLGDETAARLWETHDRISRDLLRQWRGREIDKSDGFLFLFEAAADAVGYSLAWHQALCQMSPPLTTRSGVHRGSLVIRENSSEDVALGAKPVQVEGVAKAAAARIMSLAQGGQTLLSGEVRDALPEGPWRVRCHGHWRLKGISEPLEIFEVGADDAPFTPPPDAPKAYRVVRAGSDWMPLEELPNNLPSARDVFVGRHETLLDLSRRFEEGARFVSLIGIGGIGKTRLALRYARLWLGEYPGGSWFCDLSTARGLDGILHAVAQTLNVPLGTSDPVLQLGAALAGRGPCLIILDNFEQVTCHAEQTLGTWLTLAPEVRFIVTSRETLGIQGEQVVLLPPLAPEEGEALFRERARASGIGDELGRPEEEAIPALVALLDNLPLAIELAAARVAVLPPKVLLRRMNERFKVLASAGLRHDRQATMRATLDWSWELLSRAEKETLAQLSVFEGGFTLEAVEGVVALTPDDGAVWIVDIVQALTRKSLVRSMHNGRFDLLRSVHDYAAEQLAKVGDRPSESMIWAAYRRHRTFFARLEGATVRECLADLDNLVIACRRALPSSETGAGVSCLIAAWQAIKMVGPFRSLLPLLNDPAFYRQPENLDKVKMLWLAGRIYHLLGEQESSRQYLDEGLEAAQKIDNLEWRARLLCASGEQYTTTGNVDAANDHLTRALADARSDADRARIRDTLNSLGALAFARASMQQARRYYEEALQLCVEAHDADIRGGLLGNIGEICMSLGDTDEACRYFETALALVAEGGHRRWEGNIRCNLGLLRHEQGNGAAATEQLNLALEISREIGYTRLEATVLCNLGIRYAVDGDPVSALECHQRAVLLAAAQGDSRADGQFRTYLGQVLLQAGRLDEADECLSRGEALLREINDPLSLGLLLCECAHVRKQRGQMAEALLAIDEARELAQISGAHETSELGLAITRVAQLLSRPASVALSNV